MFYSNVSELVNVYSGPRRNAKFQVQVLIEPLPPRGHPPYANPPLAAQLTCLDLPIVTLISERPRSAGRAYISRLIKICFRHEAFGRRPLHPTTGYHCGGRVMMTRPALRVTGRVVKPGGLVESERDVYCEKG